MASTGRLRILLITPRVPLPVDQGPREMLFSLVRSLAADTDVTLLVQTTSQEELEHARELEQFCERVIPYVAPSTKSSLHRIMYGAFYRLKSTIMRRSLKQIRDCPGALLHAAAMLGDEDFDIVIVSFWQLYRAAKLFPRSNTVLVTFDIDMLMNHQISLLERNLVKKIQAVRKWLMERPEELAAYRVTDHVWAVTQQDAGVVEKICRDRCKVSVLPFAIDIDAFAASGMQRNEGEILFLGRFDDPSNRDALEFFVRKIYPHLDEIRNLSITLVGGNLPDDLCYFGLLPEVEVVSHFSDVRPYLHRAACLVAPQRFGSGLRISILEAAAAGLPIVASKVAMNGLPFEASEDYLLAADPKEYAKMIRQVMEDKEESTTVSISAARRVSGEFGEARQRDRLTAMLNNIVPSAESV